MFFLILSGLGQPFLQGLLDNPFYGCSSWSTSMWSKAISKLWKTEKLTQDWRSGAVGGYSRDFSDNETPVVSDLRVSDVENPSSQALTTGSNPGGLFFLNLPLPGNSFQSACQTESDDFRITSGLYVLNHPRDARPFNTVIGSMTLALFRSSPIVPCQLPRT